MCPHIFFPRSHVHAKQIILCVEVTSEDYRFLQSYVNYFKQIFDSSKASFAFNLLFKYNREHESTQFRSRYMLISLLCICFIVDLHQCTVCVYAPRLVIEHNTTNNNNLSPYRSSYAEYSQFLKCFCSCP